MAPRKPVSSNTTTQLLIPSGCFLKAKRPKSPIGGGGVDGQAHQLPRSLPADLFPPGSRTPPPLLFITSICRGDLKYIFRKEEREGAKGSARIIFFRQRRGEGRFRLVPGMGEGLNPYSAPQPQTHAPPLAVQICARLTITKQKGTSIQPPARFSAQLRGRNRRSTYRWALIGGWLEIPNPPPPTPIVPMFFRPSPPRAPRNRSGGGRMRVGGELERGKVPVPGGGAGRGPEQPPPSPGGSVKEGPDPDYPPPLRGLGRGVGQPALHRHPQRCGNWFGIRAAFHFVHVGFYLGISIRNKFGKQLAIFFETELVCGFRIVGCTGKLSR